MDLGRDLAADFAWQFVEQIDAGRHVMGCVGQAAVLGRRGDEVGAALPGLQKRARLFDVGRAQVEGGDRQAWIVVLDEGQEAAGAAGDVDQAGVGAAPAFHEPRQGHQGLAPHGIGAAAEQHLDLMVVEFRRLAAHPAAGLVVEVLQVVARVVAARRGVAKHLAGVAGMAPAFHVAQVAKVARCHGERLDRRPRQVVRQAVVSGLDVGQVAGQQVAQVLEQTPAVGKGARDGFRRLDRRGQAGRQQVLAPEQAEPGTLAERVSGASHGSDHRGLPFAATMLEHVPENRTHFSGTCSLR